MNQESIKQEDTNKRLRSETRRFTANLSINAALGVFMEQTTDYVVLVDHFGNFSYVNPSFQKDLGYSLEELTSRKFWTFLHDEDAESTKHYYLGTRQQEISSSPYYVNRYIAKDGKQITVEWSSGGWDKNTSDYVIGIGRNVEHPDGDVLILRNTESSKVITYYEDENIEEITESPAFVRSDFIELYARDIAAHSSESTVYEYYKKLEDVNVSVIMNWHKHPSQDETIMCMDGSMIVQVERKNIVSRFINRSKYFKGISSYKTIKLTPKNPAIFIPAGVYHRILDDNSGFDCMAFWHPKIVK